MFEGWVVECHQETGEPVETLIPSVLDLTLSCQEVSRQYLLSIIFISGSEFWVVQRRRYTFISPTTTANTFRMPRPVLL